MVFVMKISSVSFDYPSEAFPGLVSLLSYILDPSTVIFGPFVRYQDYQEASTYSSFAVSDLLEYLIVFRRKRAHCSVAPYAFWRRLSALSILVATENFLKSRRTSLIISRPRVSGSVTTSSVFSRRVRYSFFPRKHPSRTVGYLWRLGLCHQPVAHRVASFLGGRRRSLECPDASVPSEV